MLYQPGPYNQHQKTKPAHLLPLPSDSGSGSNEKYSWITDTGAIESMKLTPYPAGPSPLFLVQAFGGHKKPSAFSDFDETP